MCWSQTCQLPNGVNSVFSHILDLGNRSNTGPPWARTLTNSQAALGSVPSNSFAVIPWVTVLPYVGKHILWLFSDLYPPGRSVYRLLSSFLYHPVPCKGILFKKSFFVCLRSYIQVLNLVWWWHGFSFSSPFNHTFLLMYSWQQSCFEPEVGSEEAPFRPALL